MIPLADAARWPIRKSSADVELTMGFGTKRLQKTLMPADSVSRMPGIEGV